MPIYSRLKEDSTTIPTFESGTHHISSRINGAAMPLCQRRVFIILHCTDKPRRENGFYFIVCDFFSYPCNFRRKSASNKKTSKLLHHEYPLVLFNHIHCVRSSYAFGFRQISNYKVKAIALLHIHFRLHSHMLGYLRPLPCLAIKE